MELNKIPAWWRSEIHYLCRYGEVMVLMLMHLHVALSRTASCQTLIVVCGSGGVTKRFINRESKVSDCSAGFGNPRQVTGRVHWGTGTGMVFDTLEKPVPPLRVQGTIPLNFLRNSHF